MDSAKKLLVSDSSSDLLSSDSENGHHHHPAAISNSKCKPTEERRFMKSHKDEDDDSLEDVDSDDADDEDWNAPYYDKKRPFSSRSSLSTIGPSNKSSVTNRKECSRVRMSKPRSATGKVKTSLPSVDYEYHPYHDSYRQRHQHRSSTELEFSSRRPVTNISSKSLTRANNRVRNPRSPSPHSKSSLPPELIGSRQCFGPGCTKAAARLDTKYCSEDCGLRLAFSRLKVLFAECLPPDGQSNVSMAERLDRHHLESIQHERCQLRDRLIQLEMEHQQLTGMIGQIRELLTERVKMGQPLLKMTRGDSCSDHVEQVEQPVNCVTCGSEVSMRHALRHMEKCFQKMEGNTVFCANQKEQSMGTPLFCDAYDLQAKAYCKRLRVVCEHYREPELPSDTLCGFPLVHDVFKETGDYCVAPRKKCSQHFGWERLRRAHIDLERYRHLIRMDELLQEEQRIHQSMSQRGGILGLLLHRTVDHNPSVQIPRPSELVSAADSQNEEG